MSTRKIKDAKDTSTNELIYFKGHAKATFTSDGKNVEEGLILLNNNKQDTLVSGVNIKTINNQSILGSGDITINGGSGDTKKYVEVAVKSGAILFQDNAAIERFAFSPNTVYYANGYIDGSIEIIDVVLPTSDVGEYTLHFTTDPLSMVFMGSLSVPSNWLWANGSIPTLEKGCSYELSVTATKMGSDYIYKAILTSFKTA